MADIQTIPRWEVNLEWTDLGAVISGATSIDCFGYLGEGICLAGGNNGGIARSVDYGHRWTDLGDVVSGATAVASLAYLGNGICIATTGPDSIAKSSDYGLNWQLVEDAIPDYTVDKLLNLGGGNCLAAGTRTTGTFPFLTIHMAIARSSDYGLTWETIIHEAALLGNDPPNFGSFVNMGGGSALLAYYRYDGVNYEWLIYRSDDYGRTWRLIARGTTALGLPSLMLNLNNRILVGSFESVKRSTDYGVTWTDLGTLITGEVSTNVFAYLGRGICLAGTSSNGKIARSNDYGLTWTSLGTIIAGENNVTSLAYLGRGVCLAGTSPGGKIALSDGFRPFRIIGEFFFKH